MRGESSGNFPALLIACFAYGLCRSKLLLIRVTIASLSSMLSNKLVTNVALARFAMRFRSAHVVVPLHIRSRGSYHTTAIIAIPCDSPVYTGHSIACRRRNRATVLGLRPIRSAM
jgi:hypothetical protein